MDFRVLGKRNDRNTVSNWLRALSFKDELKNSKESMEVSTPKFVIY